VNFENDVLSNIAIFTESILALRGMFSTYRQKHVQAWRSGVEAYVVVNMCIIIILVAIGEANLFSICSILFQTLFRGLVKRHDLGKDIRVSSGYRAS